MPWYPPEFNALLAVAAAEIRADGVLLAANAGFLSLLPAPGERFLGQSVVRFLVQPNFGSLAASVRKAGGCCAGGQEDCGGRCDAYSGLLTVGDVGGCARSLRGTWRCVQGRYQLLAEHDIEGLERLNQVLLEVNEKYQLTQQVLAVSNKQLRRREAEILALSQSDALTGVGNRRYLDATLQKEVTLALQTSQALSVVMADLDHFKHINDTHGHQAGDAVLAAFAAQLRQNSRASDTVARFGGEEFLVLMPQTAQASAADWAERMRSLWAHTTVPPLAGPVTASFGVASLTPEVRGVSDLLCRVDAALYRAKHNGRNCVVTAAPQ